MLTSVSAQNISQCCEHGFPSTNKFYAFTEWEYIEIAKETKRRTTTTPGKFLTYAMKDTYCTMTLFDNASDAPFRCQSNSTLFPAPSTGECAALMR